MPRTAWNIVESPNRARVITTYGTLGLLVCSVVLNIVLSRRLMAFVQPDEQSLIVGTAAPAIEARGPSGEPVEIRFDGRPMVLYYFSPNCGWCERNWINVKALVAGVGDRYRFVSLSSVPDVSGYVT